MAQQAGRFLLSTRMLSGVRHYTRHSIPINPPKQLTREQKLTSREDHDPSARTRQHKLDTEVATIMDHSFTDEDRILVPEKDEVGVISGVPEEHIKTRHVRIFVPAKSATQSGTHSTHNWRIEMDNRERWENPLMGWSGTADPLSNMSLSFGTKEQAIAYCERMGYEYHVEERRIINLRPKSYGANFSWNKRTRRATK